MQYTVARLSTAAGALLILGVTSGCVDAARIDALDASVARMRAESMQRDWEIGWLRWGQVVLAGENRQRSVERDVLVRRVAALEVENADLSARLDRTAHRDDALDAAGASGPAPARVLDETVPYDVRGFAGALRGAVARRPDKRPAPPTRSVSAHARRLDETIPYETSSSEAKVFPRVLDETVPY